MSKKYGLILPDKAKTLTFQASRNVFGNDSDSEDERSKKPVLLRPSDNINKQAKITQEKALIEDPTVYQYDEIYESMTIKKEEKKISKEEKKPKYIENLMKSAQKRKIENERRIERQIQKEREEEGDEFADKEVFVTSAYKKKLEEMKLEDEREKREEYLEHIGDVTKQKDLGGFYRHLYEQKLGPDIPTAEETTVNNTDSKVKMVLQDSEKSDKSKKRNYRKRKTSFDSKQYLSDGEIEDSDEEINRLNLDEIRLAKKAKTEQNIDADSDFSIDESSEEENIDENVKIKEGADTFKKPITKDTLTGSKSSINKDKVLNLKEEQKPSELEVKPKIDVWKKRTVGIVFEEALKRYYERKAARGS